MKTITTKEAARIIREQKDEGTFFSVTFIKRGKKNGEGAGELRKMVCRGGVVKHLQGGELPYNPADHDLIGVWDSTVEDPKRAYRSISIEGIRALKAAGEEYEVKD